MRTEKIDFGDYSELDDTRYIHNTGGDVVRAAERDNESYEWNNNEGFVTTVDLDDEYDNNPSGLRSFDPGHLVLSPPEPSDTNVVIHVQSNNARAIDTSGNRSTINFGSDNISSTNNTLNHPASSVSNILSFRPPRTNDGVFRNLVGVDLDSDAIAGADKDFVIGGFYSDKHRRDMLDYLNTLNEGPSGRTFYMNDRNVQPSYLFKIDEFGTSTMMTLDYTPLSDLFAGENLITIQDANTTSIVDTTDTSTSTHEQLAGVHVQLDETRVVIKLDPTTNVVSDYDVWNGSNSLSAGDQYTVGGADYIDDVLPLIESYLDNL